MPTVVISHNNGGLNAMRMLQVLVDRHGCMDNRRLATLGPGALIEVSNVMGRGCALASLELVFFCECATDKTPQAVLQQSPLINSNVF
jgi:hypothetical protein